MFKSINHIDTAFRHVRTFTMVIMVLCAMITCYALFRSFRLVANMQSKIYVLQGGIALQATSAARADNLEVEIRDHVRHFHELFFSIDPDEKVIREHMAQALYLADGSAKQEYDNLQESGYYTGIISGNISQRIAIDSIKVGNGGNSYTFQCFATESVIRSSSKAVRRLVTSGAIREVARSDHNPHGFLIEKWKIEENRDISSPGHER